MGEKVAFELALCIGIYGRTVFLIDVARLSIRASVYDYITSSYGMVSMAHDLIFLGPDIMGQGIF